MRIKIRYYRGYERTRITGTHPSSFTRQYTAHCLG
jgi:hypothetical protein